MLLSSFDLGIFHGKIDVFNLDLEIPFNKWTDQHNAQGFSWRSGSVSFNMLNSCTSSAVEIFLKEEINLKSDTVRSILVPFSVTSSEGIAITNTLPVERYEIVLIPAGDYALVFETGFQEQYRNDQEYQGRFSTLLPTWCRFTFVLIKNIQPEILKQDALLSPVYPLFMDTQPV